MGFGIRVPGVRVSTRGVRVGPRFASVGVSTRGRVSGSVGPRIARVSASPRGIRVGSGIGPVGVSVGRGGLRVGGGVGPIFGSVGRSGVVVGAGLGPIWAATGVGGRKQSRSHQPSRASNGRMGMSTQYKKYRDEISSSGSGRRTPDEMQIAGINAFLSSVGYLTAPLQPFIVPQPMDFNEQELAQWAEERAIQILLETKEITQRPAAIPDEVTSESMREQIRQELKSKKIQSPEHPASDFGINQERMPTHDELLSWSIGECRKTNSVFRQVLRRKSFVKEAETLCGEVEQRLPGLIELWSSEKTAYESLVNKKSQEMAEEFNENRRIQIEQNLPIQILIDQKKRDIQQLQTSVLEYVKSVHGLYVQGDPTITTLVFEALMSDNEGSAAPMGIDDGDLLVVMTAPTASEVIWPEKIKQNNRISASKKTKAELSTDYLMFLLSHAVATAREAVVASKHISQVRVLILDEKDLDKDFFSRRLIGVLNISRAELDKVPNDLLSKSMSKNAISAINSWFSSLESNDPHQIFKAMQKFESSSILDVRDFLLEIIKLLEPFAENFASYVDVPASKRPRLIDLTDANTNTSDSIQITISSDVESTKTLDVDISMLPLPDFWVLCGLLAEKWDEEEVNIDELKRTASEMCICLYSPAPNKQNEGI